MDYTTFMEWYAYEAPLWFHLLVLLQLSILILGMGPKRTSCKPKKPTEPPKGPPPTPMPTSKYD